MFSVHHIVPLKYGPRTRARVGGAFVLSLLFQRANGAIAFFISRVPLLVRFFLYFCEMQHVPRGNYLLRCSDFQHGGIPPLPNIAFFLSERGRNNYRVTMLSGCIEHTAETNS